MCLLCLSSTGFRCDYFSLWLWSVKPPCQNITPEGTFHSKVITWFVLICCCNISSQTQFVLICCCNISSQTEKLADRLETNCFFGGFIHFFCKICLIYEMDQDQFRGAKNMEPHPKKQFFPRPLSRFFNLAWNVAATNQDKLSLAWNVAATYRDKSIWLDMLQQHIRTNWFWLEMLQQHIRTNWFWLEMLQQQIRTN